MASIDFQRIRSTPKSRNDSFEALAVHLFKVSCPVPTNSIFYSLRGDGGDGGVEGYFVTPTDSKFGVQAKYFFKLGTSELRQISDSLRAALENHPSLTNYWVYIPFDLTGRKSAGRRGISEVERFEKWKNSVESTARKDGKQLTVLLCSASTISDQILSNDKHGGVRRYWFDDAVLTPASIIACLNQAKAFAGPRYTEGLDVVTHAHKTLDFFGGTGDFDYWRKSALGPALATAQRLAKRSGEIFSVLPADECERASRLLALAISRSVLIEDAHGVASLVQSTREVLAELRPLASQARELQEKTFAEKHGAEHDTPSFRQFQAEYNCVFPAGPMDAARETEKLIEAFDEILMSPLVQASSTQSLLLVGPAGVGKTHALVSAAERRLLKGGYSLVVFGEDFGRAEPWEVIRSKLGFGADISREGMLECMNACAQYSDLPFVVAIDALNESPKEARWKSKLPELLQQCREYPGIKVCVSTRDTYRDLVVDVRFPGFAFYHAGFGGCEFEALQAFASFYELDAEITPLFAPELANPLFLHVACRVIKQTGGRSLDMSLPGFTSLFESHLSICDKSVRTRLNYCNPQNLVRAAMVSLANLVVSGVPNDSSWSNCVDAIRPIVGSEITPEMLLRELEREGMLILTNPIGDEWLIRIAYQRYGDVLRAIGLVETSTVAGKIDVPRIGDRLKSLTADEGLLEALSVILPERARVEVTASALGLDVQHSNRLFVRGLPLRSRESIPQDIESHILAALSIPGLWKEVYEAFFKLCLVPSHPLNVERYLNQFLRSQTIVDRDAYLSVAAFKSFDAGGAVKSLIEASQRAEISRWPTESLRLATSALGWLTSCADRRVRDQATKALSRILVYSPTLSVELVEAYSGCDDDYVQESVVLAVYAASLLRDGSLSAYVPALDALVSSGYETANVLVRDTVRLLAVRLENAGIPATLQSKLARYPTRATAPSPWPTRRDAESLLSLEHLPSNMDLLDASLAPDFWRYVVQSRVSEFDLASARISLQNIAAWIMVETLNIGYPGHKNSALQYDLALNSEFGFGRGRRGYAERLGKKYYWICLHRLLGVLADNVTPAENYSGWRPGRGFFWSAGVRKSDPTDVRDLPSEVLYPDELLAISNHAFPPRAADMKEWVCSDDFPPREEYINRVAFDETEWVALSLSMRESDRTELEDSWSKPYLMMDFHYTSLFAPTTGIGRDIVSRLDSAMIGQGSHCHRCYMAEYPDGPVFHQCIDEGDTQVGSGNLLFTEVSLMRGNEWEYEYSSASIQETLCVPCQSLVQSLKLKWDQHRGWTDEVGDLAAFEAKAAGRSALFIRRHLLNRHLSTEKLALIYRRFARRGLIDSGANGCQIEISTYLRYKRTGKPLVFHEQKNIY